MGGTTDELLGEEVMGAALVGWAEGVDAAAELAWLTALLGREEETGRSAAAELTGTEALLGSKEEEEETETTSTAELAGGATEALLGEEEETGADDSVSGDADEPPPLEEPGPETDVVMSPRSM